MEFKITADMKEMEQLIAKWPQAAHDAQVSRVTEASLLMEGAIKQLTPVGAGPIHLRDTIFHKIEAFGENVWGLISTPAVYGEPVELGTRPHFPPVAPIQHWVEKQMGLSGSEAKSVAFLIARAISKRGTKAQKMFTISVEQHEADVIRILEQIPADILQKVTKGH
jgi:hypothetical protein